MTNNIHATANVHETAVIGKNVTISEFVIVGANVHIGDYSKIGPYCYLGATSSEINSKEIRISKNSLIRSHSVIYEGSEFGDYLETGHHVTIRENTFAGANLRVGSYSDLQGDLEIGDYVRLHSSVHLGKKTKIGNFVWIFPFVVTTNDPLPPSNIVTGCELSDYVVVATGSVLLPGTKIGRDSVIGANSTITRDVPPNSLVIGSPGKVVRTFNFDDLNPSQHYPWRRFFSRGYPKEIIDKWKQEFKDFPGNY